MPCVVLSATETGNKNFCIHTSLSLGGLISARLLHRDRGPWTRRVRKVVAELAVKK